MPHTHKIATIRNAMALILISILLTGCKFDPSQTVYSDSQPVDQTDDDGTAWTALPYHDCSNAWYYVPVEFAQLAGARPAPTRLQFNLLVNGSIYSCTKIEGKGYTYDGKVNADISTNPGVVFLAITLGGLVVAMLIVASAQSLQLQIEKGNVESGCKELAELKKRSQVQYVEIEKVLTDVRGQLAAAEEAIALERSDMEMERLALAAEKDRVEQLRNTLTIAARATNLRPKVPKQGDWQHMSSVVRAEMFRGSGYSNELFVSYFFDPKTSGAIIFEWEITLTGLRAPTVIILRDGKEVSRQSGMFKGKFPTRLLNLEKRYDFTFKVHDGKREYAMPLLMEVIAPPFEAFRPKAPKKEKKETRAQWIAKSVKHLKESRQWPEDPEKQKILMAKIEAEAMEIFQAEGE